MSASDPREEKVRSSKEAGPAESRTPEPPEQGDLSFASSTGEEGAADRAALGAENSSAVWFVATPGGKRQGPFQTDEVQQKLTAGVFTPKDLAWQEGMQNWISLGELPRERCKLDVLRPLVT